MKELINNNYNSLVATMIGICIIGVIIILLPLIFKKKDTTKTTDNKTLNNFETDISLEELTQKVFNLYKTFSIARSKFDYDTLKETVTEKLYLEEEKELKDLKEQKHKIVATNIQLKDMELLDIKKKEDIETITAKLHVSQYDYIINKQKEVIRGVDTDQYQIEYRIIVENNKIKEIKTLGKWIKNN